MYVCSKIYICKYDVRKKSARKKAPVTYQG